MLAIAQQARHRTKEPRREGGLEARIGDAEMIDPVDLGPQPPHHAEAVENTDQKHANDESIETHIGHEGALDLRKQDHRQDGHQEGEHHHANEINLGKVENCLLSGLCHGLPVARSSMRWGQM